MDATQDMWHVELLGDFRVLRGGRVVDKFHTRQTALLLAYLTVFPRRHSREELIDLLWPDADLESGRSRLSQAIWRLRQILQAPDQSSADVSLIADRNTVAINPAQVTSDVTRFREYLQQAAKLEGAAHVEALERAAAAYGGSGVFLSGYYDDWVLAERQSLLTNYLDALKTIASYFEKAGDWQRALAAAERAVNADPLIEDSHYDLIRILAASGQPSAAQRQYTTLTRLLARELNSEPSGATRALMAQVHQAVTPPRTPAALSATQTPLLRVMPLPIPLTTFYGREIFVQEIGALLNDPAIRLVTLLGTGGVGKTRLAVELARGVETRSVDPAVAFVSLADIAEPRMVVESIAAALTPLREAPPMQRIENALTTSPSAATFLLVLDNAEHMADQLGGIAVDLLTRIPRLKLLITSQRGLGVSGEHEIMLTPLELPHAKMPRSSNAIPAQQSGDDIESAPSERLFLDRARSVRPGFASDAAGLDNVALICERLEGLPLAIELCAGWAQTLGTGQMLEMLTQRFDLLVSRRTDIPARHRTLRAAIEYSYVHLTKTAQDFFVQLSVFRNGWTLAAAADVCTGGSVPAALTMLAQMRERSLIAADEAHTGDGMRYKMLESLREFAAEQQTMAQEQQHAEAHAVYFARFVQETVTRMSGPENTLWAMRLDDEMENIRAALEHLISGGEIEQAWAVTAAASKAWNANGHARESHQWIARALTIESPITDDEQNGSERGRHIQRLRARLLTTQAETLRALSDFTAAAASAASALAIWEELGDAAGMTECLDLMGVAAMLHDDFDNAQALLTQALPLARTLGDLNTIAQTLNDLGRVAMALQDWPTALDRLTEGLELRRRLGDMRLVCSSLGNLGLVHRYQGDYAAARVLLQEAVFLQNQHGIVWYSSLDLNLATVERLDGHYAESLRLLSLTLIKTRATGERRVVAWCLKEMGHLAIVLKQYTLGLRLLACAEAMRATIGMSFKPLGPQDIERDRTECEQALGISDAAANWTVGASSDPDMLLDQAQIALTEVTHSIE